jgi:hypothetical protein
MKVIKKKKIDIDKLPTDTKSDIVDNLAETIPDLKNISRQEIWDNLFGLVEEVPVYIGLADPLDIIRKFGKERKVSKKTVAKYIDMLKHGIEFDPILISRNKFIDGGHRVAAYAKMKKKIPVVDIYNIVSMDWKKWLSGEEIKF